MLAYGRTRDADRQRQFIDAGTGLVPQQVPHQLLAAFAKYFVDGRTPECRAERSSTFGILVFL
jgi:hypothetical protein